MGTLGLTPVSYISFPVNIDYDTLLANALDALSAAIPGWVPHEGNLEVQLLEVIARMDVDAATVAALVPPGIFRWYGRNLVNIQPIDAVTATVPSTWTLADTSGHTIKAGTVVGMAKSGDENVFFTVRDDVVVAPGSLITAVGEVVLVATVPGTNANGIGAGSVFLIDSLAWVNSIASTATTAGGVDAETDSDYLSRLSAELKLLTPRPILPNDFAVLALNTAGVARAHAVDGYNPGDDTFGNERMVAVALVDSAGAAVTSGIKTIVQTALDAQREVNFVVNVMDATYNTINVTVTVHKLASADSTVVHDACMAALEAYLSPNNWDWSGVVRVNELISLLDQVPGVDYVITPSAPGADVTLTGAAPLPTSGAIAVTVVA